MLLKRIFFAKIALMVRFETRKTSGEDGGSEGQLYFAISDDIHSPIVILFPLHQPAPASTSPGLPY